MLMQRQPFSAHEHTVASGSTHRLSNLSKKCIIKFCVKHFSEFVIIYKNVLITTLTNSIWFTALILYTVFNIVMHKMRFKVMTVKMDVMMLLYQCLNNTALHKGDKEDELFCISGPSRRRLGQLMLYF